MISVTLAPNDVFELGCAFADEFTFDLVTAAEQEQVALVLPLVVASIDEDYTESGLLRCVDPYYLYHADVFPLNHWRNKD